MEIELARLLGVRDQWVRGALTGEDASTSYKQERSLDAFGKRLKKACDAARKKIKEDQEKDGS